MKMEALPTVPGVHNMGSYEETCATFKWEDVEKEFSWFETHQVNMAYEAIDRHTLTPRKNKVALIYRDATREEKYTFEDLRRASNRAANVLKNVTGVEKGDRVFIFMPRQPELYFTLLGALKVGAIVGPLFEAFMEAAVKDRLEDSEAKVIVTTPELLPRIPLDELPALKHVILVGSEVEESDRFVDFYKHFQAASPSFDIQWVGREDGLILHYTSGSTGKPKGVLHVHNAMIQHYQTSKWTLDLQETDVYWCTADPGWVTGTSYGIFGPWLNGATNVVLGGRFNPETWYETIERYGVTVWYSAPTAFRMLMGAGDAVVEKFEMSSLRHILSVGEPLNPEVIRWGNKVF
ncbi:MAG: AMP-binding protein, partial [Bacilli bacterium]